MKRLLVIFALLVGSSAIAHADPQGTWWIDPDSGTYSLVDPTNALQASGCTSLVELHTDGQ